MSTDRKISSGGRCESKATVHSRTSIINQMRTSQRLASVRYALILRPYSF